MSFSPLNINSIGQLLQNQGLQINPIAQSFMGISEFSHSNYTKGSTVAGTVLNALVDSIQIAYNRNILTDSVYNQIISIGSNSISALGDSKPVTFTNTYNREMTQWGWLRLIPWQAWREFYINNGSYTDFCSTFSTCFGKYNQLNLPIDAANNSIDYLDQVYSNMNDLISADITGVSLSTFYWGQDLIKSGRAIDLLEIDAFGEPDALLRNLNKNKAITQALGLALLSVGFTDTEVKWLSAGTIKATFDQQKLMYAAFCLITDADLTDVLIPLNCQTTGLTTLADLLDPKKLFPNSYMTLTVPVFNASPQPTNSKTYYLIYSTSGGVNAQIANKFESRLIDILPTDIAQSAGAFSAAMLQIRNIQSMSIEKFSQAVMNLENVSDLNVNGTNVPTNTSLAQSALAYLALGTGDKGRYSMCDFFGAMTNIHYPHKLLTDQIINLQTQKLFNIYSELRLTVSWDEAKMRMAQPYWATTVTPYVPPTASPNPPNPDYNPPPPPPDPLPPDYEPPVPGPGEPPYDPYPYLNGATGAKTYSPGYYSSGGSPATYNWYYQVEISQFEQGGGYGRGTAPDPLIKILPNNVGASAVSTVTQEEGASALGPLFGRVSSTTIRNGAVYLFKANDVQANWVDKSGQDTMVVGTPTTTLTGVTGGTTSDGTVIGPSGPTELPPRLLDRSDPYYNSADGWVWGSEDGGTNRWYFIVPDSGYITTQWQQVNPTWNSALKQWQWPDGSDATSTNGTITVLPDGTVTITSTSGGGGGGGGGGSTGSDGVSLVPNSPTPPIFYGGYPGKGPVPRDIGWIRGNMPKETIEIEYPPTALLPVSDIGKSTNGTNTPGEVWADLFVWGGVQSTGTKFWSEPGITVTVGNNVTQSYIDQANTEIAAIQTRNPTASLAINNTYKIFGTYLKKEQDARALALPNLEELTSQPSDIVVFVNGSASFALDTTTCGASNVLNQIYNPAYLGGRSLVGGLREIRNQSRLSLAGGALDNDVNGTVEIQLPRPNGVSLSELIGEKPSQGFLSAYPLPPGEEVPPGYIVDPIGDLLPDGPTNGYGDPPFDNWNLNKPVPDYTVGTVILDYPIYNGQPDVPGSFAGSPDSNLIPDNLSIIVTPSVQTILTPDQAIAEVVRCNCDCWDDL